MSRVGRVLRTSLIVATGFLALTAIPGGALLLAGIYSPPVEMLRGSRFDSFVVPGLALALGVGGSALAATVLLARRRASAPLAAGLAGLVVMTFEFVQVVSIGSPPGPSRTMQIGYFALGAGIAAAALAMERGYGDRLPRYGSTNR